MGRLREFVIEFAKLLDDDPVEKEILGAGGELLGDLVRHDDWLPPVFAECDPSTYRQYLLHCDSCERFSLVSFVWGPGQGTPIHDHTVWGLIGMLRGGELSQRYVRSSGGMLPDGPSRILSVGDVESLSPAVGDIHKVSNAHSDRSSISIHVYGANIGRVWRTAFDSAGSAKAFVSGYSNNLLPNVWADQ